MGRLPYAARRLAQSPLFALTVIVTLAVGIGANTAIFTVVNAVLLRPLAYPQPDRLVQASLSNPSQRLTQQGFSLPRFEFIRDHSTAFEGISIFTFERFNLADASGDPIQLAGARVSANFFDVLGVRPAIGRAFRSDEERPGAAGAIALATRCGRGVLARILLWLAAPFRLIRNLAR